MTYGERLSRMYISIYEYVTIPAFFCCMVYVRRYHRVTLWRREGVALATPRVSSICMWHRGSDKAWPWRRPVPCIAGISMWHRGSDKAWPWRLGLGGSEKAWPWRRPVPCIASIRIWHCGSEKAWPWRRPLSSTSGTNVRNR